MQQFAATPVHADGPAGDREPELGVLSVPSSHPYVRSVTAGAGIRAAVDDTDDRRSWQPSVALDPVWIVQHAADADLLHIHFGTESFSAHHLASCIAAAHRVGWPVVFSMHDLDHPQLSDQSDYLRQLDVLVPGADAVVTLTRGAAAEVRRRWNRPALVVPHPSVLPATAPLPRVFPADEVRIGMHLKDIRPNVDAVSMTAAVAGALRHLQRAGVSAVAEVRMHRDVRDAAARDAVRSIAADNDRMVLIEHGRLDDRELANSLARLDVCVLPYRHGTHSGWLELCWDLGVGVAAPAVGYYAEQHASVVSFSADDHFADDHSENDQFEDDHSADGAGDSLAQAVATLLAAPDGTRAGTDARAEEFDRRRAERALTDEVVATAHAELYRSLLAGRRS